MPRQKNCQAWAGGAAEALREAAVLAEAERGFAAAAFYRSLAAMPRLAHMPEGRSRPGLIKQKGCGTPAVYSRALLA